MVPKPELWIIGAGGFGREVLMFARDAITAGAADYVIGGLLDDRLDVLAGRDVGALLQGPIDAVEITDDKVFCIAFGSPQGRLAMGSRMAARGARFINIIHPTAMIGERTKVGVGCIFAPHSGVSCDAVLGDHVALGFRTAVGHDAQIGAGSVLTGFCAVNGAGVLGGGVFLGSHSVVLPGVRLGDGAKTMAGTVVMRDVPAGAQVGGNPARTVPAL